MKSLLYVLILGLGVASASAVASPVNDSSTPAAVQKVKKTKKKAAKQPKQAHAKKGSSAPELQTDVKFDDSVLHGQYQSPEEALAKVENEKALSDLLGVRKHFKDRLQTASEQE